MNVFTARSAQCDNPLASQDQTRGGAARSVEGFTAVPRRRVGVNDQVRRR